MDRTPHIGQANRRSLDSPQKTNCTPIMIYEVIIARPLTGQVTLDRLNVYVHGVELIGRVIEGLDDRDKLGVPVLDLGEDLWNSDICVGNYLCF
jgi:hypothetical protein